MNKNYSFKAVIFDMDGVITKTALTHAAAWKKMFDEYLRKREKEHGEPFREFTHITFLRSMRAGCCGMFPAFIDNVL